ncbi:MAG: prephenate dehydrogenase/arogenate dehydrogenase family protein, partial [Rhizobiales bacterium]|nr:prephenate dehydrogenase/arogenate dehydrogenase family protein [Hyphomicrobiales bacterium]
MFDKIALIGLGLIGSSLCHVIRREGLAVKIAGHARSAETLATALKIGLVDDVYEDAADAVDGADLVILCVPVGAIGTVAEAISGKLKAGAIVTDVGSVKGQVIRDLAPLLPDGVILVPGHPLAGTEHSGPES